MSENREMPAPDRLPHSKPITHGPSPIASPVADDRRSLVSSEPIAHRPSPLASPVADDRRWYALLTQARHEKRVRDRLLGQGIEPFLPTMKRLSQWKDRKQMVEEPLFSCYCFAHFNREERLAVLNVPGVFQVIGSGSRPEAIPNEEIDSLKMLMCSALEYQAHPYLAEGMMVQVVRGPLEGVTGILLRKAKPYRLVLSVNLIQQAASVEIDADDVVAVREHEGVLA